MAGEVANIAQASNDRANQGWSSILDLVNRGIDIVSAHFGRSPQSTAVAVPASQTTTTKESSGLGAIFAGTAGVLLFFGIIVAVYFISKRK